MNHRLVAASALASVVATGLATATSAHGADDKAKEKCYGIAKAGQNDCANLSATHACTGESKTDHAVDEWKYVAAGTCKQLKGLTEAEAKARLKGKKA
jgi:uncharacterized membrane protein